MFKFISRMFTGSGRGNGPELKTRLTLNGMEERATPAALTAQITEPMLVAHVTPLEIHAFNPQPDPPAHAIAIGG